MSHYKKVCRYLLLSICGIMLSCSGGDVQKNLTETGTKSTAKVLSNDFRLTSDPTDQSQPAIAYDSISHNKYLTAFVDDRNGSQIFAAISVGSDSGEQGEDGNVTTVAANPVSFAVTTAVGNKTQPKVAFYPNKVAPELSRYLVVWTDSRNGYGQIYGQFVDTAGVLIGVNFSISSYTAGQDINQQDPDLIFNPVTGKFVVAWVDTSTYDTPLNPANTATYTAASAINSITVDHIPLPQSDTNLVRTAEVDPLTSVVANVRAISKLVSNNDSSDDGSIISSSWTVQLNEAHPKLSYSPISGELFTSWTGTTSTVTLTIPYTLVSDGGEPPVISAIYMSAVFTAVDLDGGQTKVKLRRNAGLNLLKDYTFGTAVASVALAVDPHTNRLLVAWEEHGVVATGKDINAQLIDLSGFTSYGAFIPVSNAVGDQTSPVAAFDNVNQRFLVAWEDARNQNANLSNMDIYSQFIDPQGNLSGGNAIVTVAVGNQLAPAVAFGDVNFRKFFLVWKDGRALSNADIFGQMLEFSSAPQLVITDADGSPILNGSIDFGNVATGQQVDVPIKLRNDGNTQLTIVSMSTPDAPFSFVTPAPVTISPGNSYDMTIRFSPTSAGSFAGNEANNYRSDIDSDGGTAVLYFSGSGVGINPLSVTTPSLPDANTGVPYSASLNAAGGVFPYSWSAVGLPDDLAIDPGTGTISGTPMLSGSYSVTVTVTDNNSPKSSASRTFTLKVGVVSITTTSLKPWTQGVNYSIAPAQSIAASGGTAPYSFTLVGGGLPTGMSLSAPGVLSGVPGASGSFSFTVQASDSLAQTTTQTFELVINPPPSILTSSLPLGVVGVAYLQTVRSTGGTLPNTWSISTGSLPGGLTFNTGTGIISGTPTAPGNYPVTFTLTDSTGASISRAMAIQINSILDITNPTSGAGSPPDALFGTDYVYTFVGTGGTSPYSWSVIAGSLPLGLSLNPFTGALTGSPLATGTFAFSLQLQDTIATTVVKNFQIKVSQPLSIATSSLSDWTQGSPGYSQTIAATGGDGSAYSWSISAGALPDGLTLNQASGLVTGTPSVVTAPANSNFTVTVSSGSLTAFKNLSIFINAPLQITTTSLGNGVLNALYLNGQLLLTGGKGPYLWSMNAGALPAGLVLSSSGLISGTATATGTYNFSVQATDATGVTAVKTLSINVDPTVSDLSIETTGIADMKTDVAISVTLLSNGDRSRFNYIWGVSGGSLPTGFMTLNPSGGTLAGTPTQAGDYTFDIMVIEYLQGVATGRTAFRHFMVSVRDPLLITTDSLKTLEVQTSGYLDTLSGTGGRGPYVWSTSNWTRNGVAVVGADSTHPLGAGTLTLNPSAGTISGTTPIAGSYSFTVTMTDAATPVESITKQLSILITAPMLVTTSPSPLPGLVVGTPVSFTMLASGGTSPVQWTSTTLPAGLSLNPNTGVVSGTPVEAGTIVCRFNVSDATGRTATSLQTLDVLAPITQSNFMDFGNIAVNSGNTRSVTVTNTSNAPMTITGITNPANAAFTITYLGTSPPATLLPGASYTFMVNATVALEGNYSSSFVIQNNSPAGNQTITVQALAVLPVVSIDLPKDPSDLSRYRISMVDILTNQQASQLIVMKNTSIVPVVINGFSLPYSGLVSPSPFRLKDQATGFFISATDSFTIAPGASFNLMLVFTPTTAGSFNSNIGIIFDHLGPNDPTNITLNAATVPSFISLKENGSEITELDFGSVKANTKGITKSFIVSNDGDQDVTASLSSATEPFFERWSDQYDGFFVTQKESIASKQSDSVVVKFSPTTRGDFSQVLTVSTDTGVTKQLLLKGKGVAPILRVLPISLDFGTVSVGSSVTKTVTLYNDGDGNLDITSLGSLPSGYSFASTPTTILPGQNTNLAIKFAPNDTGIISGSLTLSTDGGDQAIGLTGSGTGPKLVLSAGQLDFGSVATNQQKTFKLTISNNGSAPMNITDITLPSAPYTLYFTGGAPTAANPIQLLPGTSMDAFVVFKPVAAGTFPGSFIVTSDAINVPLGKQTINLQGFAFAPDLSVTPNPIDFTATAVNTSQTKTVTITNNSTGPVQITGLLAPAAPFAVVSNLSFPTQLDPGNSTLVQVKFTPTGGGSFSSSLGVQFNTSATPSLVNITGVGASSTQPVGSLVFLQGATQVNTLDFGNVLRGLSLQKTITLSNTGQSLIEIASVTLGNSGVFSPDSSLSQNFSLAAGTNRAINITFFPTAVASYSDTLSLRDKTGAIYQLSLTANGVPLNVVSNNGAASYFNTRPSSFLPNGSRPSDFTALQAYEYTLTGLSAGASADVSVTFDSLPDSPVFYEVNGDVWTRMTTTPSAGMITYTAAGKTITYRILAQNTTFSDVIVVGTNSTPNGVPPENNSGSAANSAPPSSGGGGGCFIATAAFGSYLDPHVVVLRHFRDNVLLKSQAGSAFVDFYYRYSPPIADFIAEHPSLRVLTRWALTPLIVAVKFARCLFLLAGAAALLFGSRNRGCFGRKSVARQV